MRRLDEAEGQELLSAVTRRGEVVVEGHPVGHVDGFRFFPDPLAEGDENASWCCAPPAARCGRRCRAASARLEAAAGRRVRAGPKRIACTWDGAPIARLLPGATRAAAARRGAGQRVPRRRRARAGARAAASAIVDDAIRADLAPLFAADGCAARSPALRGPLHRLTEALGVVPGATEDDHRAALRGRLKALGVRAGRFALFLPALLKPRADCDARAAVVVCGKASTLPALPSGGLVSLRAADPTGRRVCDEALGWLDAGPVLLRLDIAERVAGELAWATRHGASALPAGLACRFAVKAELLPAVLRRLGFRLVPAVGAGARRLWPAGAGDDPAAAPPAPGAGAGEPGRSSRRRRSVRRAGGAEALARAATLHRQLGTAALAARSGWQRLDKWLWCARFMKRAATAPLDRGGGLRLNRQPTDKPHARLRVGDVLTLPLRGGVRVVAWWRWRSGAARRRRRGCCTTRCRRTAAESAPRIGDWWADCDFAIACGGRSMLLLLMFGRISCTASVRLVLRATSAVGLLGLAVCGSGCFPARRRRAVPTRISVARGAFPLSDIAFFIFGRSPACVSATSASYWSIESCSMAMLRLRQFPPST